MLGTDNSNTSGVVAGVVVPLILLLIASIAAAILIVFCWHRVKAKEAADKDHTNQILRYV